LVLAENAFSIDANTGIVRTKLENYIRGNYYKVFVQARDRSSNARSHKESGIAILEVFCGDRAPQFLQPAYSVKIPENLEIGHR
jgi:hypothetical protein